MKSTLLVVDDEPPVLKILQTRLKASGYEVLTASDGRDALEKIKANPPDLIVLDVLMPEVNGFQVCRTLKDDPALSGIPILMLTAKDTESDRFWGAEAGADAYMTKPYNAEELLTQIQELLSR